MTSTRSSREERKNSQFRRVFWWQLKNIRVYTIFYSVCLLAALPLSALIYIVSCQDFYTNLNNWPAGTTLEQLAETFANAVAGHFKGSLSLVATPVCIIFMVLFCWKAFGYMHARRSVDLFHALPVRRLPLLLGSYVAVLVSLVAPLGVAVGLSRGVCFAYHIGKPLTSMLFLRSFGLMALLTAASMTFIMFFIVTSGTPLNTVISLLAVAGGWPLAVHMVNETLSLFLPGYVSVIPDMVYTALCPFGAYFYAQPFSFSLFFFYLDFLDVDLTVSTEPAFLIWWGAFTLVLLLASVLYYSRRKSENAENAFSFPVIRGLIRFLLSFTFGLSCGELLGSILDSNYVYLAGIVIGSFVAHLVYHVIMTRGFRRFWLSLPAYAVALAALGGFLYTLYNGGLGYVTRVPMAGRVTSAEFQLPDLSGDDSLECYLAPDAALSLWGNKNEDYLADLLPTFTELEDIEALCAFHQAVLTKYPAHCLPYNKPDISTSSFFFTIDYTLSDGSTLSRSYSFPVYADDKELLAALASVQKRDTYQSYQLFFSATAEDISDISVYEYTGASDYDAMNSELTDDQKQQLWDTFVSEVTSPGFTNPTTLPTKEEATASSNDTESTERTYTISLHHIPVSQLSPDVQELIDTFYGTDADIPVSHVSGHFSYGSDYYEVPECCPKTRALIDQYTEEYGSYYYYDETNETQLAETRLA